MNYPIAEIFYSLKGEGTWTGTPMAFIRLAGCNKKCTFCDTDFRRHYLLNEKELYDRISVSWPDVLRVVITGGEPLIRDLRPLIDIFHRHNYSLHLETNATIYKDEVTYFDWIACSPKTKNYNKRLILEAHEIKVLAGNKGWKQLAKQVEEDVGLDNTKLLIMPLAPGLVEGRNELSDVNTQTAINFCKANPNWSLCLQVHKYLQLP